MENVRHHFKIPRSDAWSNENVCLQIGLVFFEEEVRTGTANRAAAFFSSASLSTGHMLGDTRRSQSRS